MNGNATRRIEYLDLIKGFCILLVIADHSSIVDPSSCFIYRMLDHIEVTGFFVVSGMLYNPARADDSIKFIIDKTKRLIIPFAFFLVLFLLAFIHHIFSTDNISFTYLLIKPANGPLWFLRGLFIALITFSILEKTFLRKSNTVIQAIIIITLTALATMITDIATASSDNSRLARLWINLNFASAGIGLFWIWVGCTIQSNSVTIDRISSDKKFITAILICSGILWATLSAPGTAIHTGRTPSPLLFYPAALSGFIFIMICSKSISRIAFVNYLGRNSIIVLGTHYIILTAIAEFMAANNFNIPSIVNLSVTIALMPPIIGLIKKFCPPLLYGSNKIIK